jgi:hypothetical protein
MPLDNLLRLLGEQPVKPMARGGAAKQEIKESLQQAINAIREKFANKAQKAKAEPIANERAITSAVTRAAADIEKANPAIHWQADCVTFRKRLSSERHVLKHF